MSTILTGTDLYKSYTLPHQRVDVLQGASIKVDEGESVAVVGASGAGKSTLLHVIGGLDVPEQGKVFIGDDELYSLNSKMRSTVQSMSVGFVFQSYHLFPEMDLRENVMLPAMALPPALRQTANIRERARELIASVGLSERERHTPYELSGGEQQRIALARALMNAPRLILADEPTGNLDSDTGSHVLELLFGLISGGGHALVMVTHNADVASRCDRKLHLLNGLLV